MTTSTFDSKEAEPYVATPSVTLDDGKTMQDLPFWCHKVKPGSAIEAAGFLFSTANDMIKWLKYLMRTMKNENDLNDPKIISFKTLRELIKPRIITSLQTLFSTSERGQPAYPEFSTPLYGLGVQRWHLQLVTSLQTLIKYYSIIGGATFG